MNWFSPPARNLKPELLDLNEASFEEIRDSLGDVRQVNNYLGGYRVLLCHVSKFLRSHQRKSPFTVLDMATGSADQPVELVKLARRLRVPIKVVAVDINRKMLDYALEDITLYPEIKLLQCDILSIPFCENSFDLTINNLSFF